MNTNVVREVAAIRFAGAMNYSLDGDLARVELDLEILDEQRAATGEWSVQFCTCEQDCAVLSIAEFRLGTFSAPAGAIVPVSAIAIAIPPAGNRSHTVALRLVRDGALEGREIHDFATFSCPQDFLLPRLSGAVAYCFGDATVALSVDSVQNPRAAGSLSGSLSLELWALPAPYSGGSFAGSPVAGIQIGSLAGQDSTGALSYDLPAATLPAGESYLCLMLREWTPAGFVTRDYSNFAQPLWSESAPAPVPACEPSPAAESAPVAEPAAVVAPVAVAPAAIAETVAKVAAVESKAPVAEAPKAPVADSAKAVAPVATSAKAAAPVAPKAAAVAVAPKPAATATTATTAKKPQATKAAAALVSVNSATVLELAEVKGVSRALAEAIVAGRPYKSLDDLSEVRGVGDKLLGRLRPLLKV